MWFLYIYNKIIYKNIKGVPAWESHTGTQLVSPAVGCKKKKMKVSTTGPQTTKVIEHVLVYTNSIVSGLASRGTLMYQKPGEITYFFISFNLAITHHRACGHGQNWLLVLCHRLTGWLWKTIGQQNYIEYEKFSKMANLNGQNFQLVTGHTLGQIE